MRVKHHSKSWSPIGGSANSIVHETEFGLFVVDYYISMASETIIKNDSVVVYGDDSLKRGEWRLNRIVDENIHDSHTFKKDLDLLIDLIFISIKGIVRKWTDDTFIKNMKIVYKKFKDEYKIELKNRRINLNYKSYLRLLNDIYHISNKRQKHTINAIKRYIRQIEKMY